MLLWCIFLNWIWIEHEQLLLWRSLSNSIAPEELSMFALELVSKLNLNWKMVTDRPTGPAPPTDRPTDRPPPDFNTCGKSWSSFINDLVFPRFVNSWLLFAWGRDYRRRIYVTLLRFAVLPWIVCRILRWWFCKFHIGWWQSAWLRLRCLGQRFQWECSGWHCRPHTCMHVCVCVCMFTYKSTHVHVSIYIYVYIYI